VNGFSGTELIPEFGNVIPLGHDFQHPPGMPDGGLAENKTGVGTRVDDQDLVAVAR
jgi:hypothetical protein